MKLRPLKYEAGRSVVSDIICLISIRAAIHPNPKKNGISKSHQSSNSTITNATATARDQVHIAGSSTVLPYASIVAEAFGENFEFPTPIVEGGGSGAGRKRMC